MNGFRQQRDYSLKAIIRRDYKYSHFMISAVVLHLSAFYRVEEKMSSLALAYLLFNVLFVSLNAIC